MSSPNPALLPTAYIPNPNAARDRAESEVLRLRERLEERDHRIRLLLRTVHNQHELLAAIGKENGEHCDACAGTGRDLLGQRSKASESDWLHAWETQWDALDTEYPDDCDAVGCFSGWRVEAPR